MYVALCLISLKFSRGNNSVLNHAQNKHRSRARLIYHLGLIRINALYSVTTTVSDVFLLPSKNEFEALERRSDEKGKIFRNNTEFHKKVVSLVSDVAIGINKFHTITAKTS